VLADLSTDEGRQFATRYQTRETTLVFFDRYGNFLHQQYGVPTALQLRTMIDATFNLASSSDYPASQRAEAERLLRQYNETARRTIDSMGR
jgi:hypothetical protein